MERSNYPALVQNPDTIHLDVSSSFPLHENVIKAANDAMLLVGSPDKGSYDGAIKAQQTVEQTRQDVADFLGADSDEIFFCHSATQAANDLIACLKNSGGGKLIYSPEDHASNAKLHQNGDIKLNYNMDGTYALSGHEEELVGSIFLATHVHQLYGTNTDFLYVKDKLKPWATILDISQSVSRAPINLGKLNIDAAYFSGQKIGGLAGVGVVYIRRKSQNKFSQTDDLAGTLKNIFEPHTVPVVAVASLGAAVRVLNDYGMQNMVEYFDDTTQDLVLARLANMQHVRLAKGVAYSHKVCSGYGIVSFELEGYDPSELGMILGDQSINVRSGGHCTLDSEGKNLTRMSWHAFTSRDDLNTALDAIESLC